MFLAGEDAAAKAVAAGLAAEIGHLQVFLACIDDPIVRRHASGSGSRFAEGDDYLW